MKVLIIGNGSIGKQHTLAVLRLGHSPIVQTKYPEKNEHVLYVNSIKDSYGAEAAIICTPTSQHINDFNQIVKNTKIKKILIEKPLTSNSIDALKIKRIAEKNNIEVFVAFDMRFIPHLQYVREKISAIKKRIRLVKIHCGQYLADWRPGTDYRKSYSSNRSKGGGVDLDLTHEIDYMLWLFGKPDKIDFLKTYKISSLEINSPDYFKAIYNYRDFIIDVELDYFRPLDRKLILLGENELLVELDFIKKTLIFEGKLISFESNLNALFDEDDEFLEDKLPKNLCSLNESINVLKMINV
jgi:predicted dehydrogenase